MRFFTSLIAALILAASAQSQDASGLVSLKTFDATRVWQGVGRLNIGRIGFCTGTLVAPDLVLTAAHCLYDLSTGQRAEDADIEFLAGWRDGRASAYRGVRHSVVHDSYQFRGRADTERVGADIALLQLDQPIRHPSITPFQTGNRAPRGQELKVVSYARDRADAPALQNRCHVLEKDLDLYVTSCEVDFGSSGAPVFVVGEDGRPVIMSVVSAKAEWKEQHVSLATGVADRFDELRMALTKQTASSGGTRLNFQSGLQPSGARFLKP